MFLITAIDDPFYQRAGYVINGTDTPGTVVNSITLKKVVDHGPNEDGSVNGPVISTTTLYANDVNNGATNGLISHIQRAFGTVITILPYWVTPDGVRVTGIQSSVLDTTSKTYSGRVHNETDVPSTATEYVPDGQTAGN